MHTLYCVDDYNSVSEVISQHDVMQVQAASTYYASLTLEYKLFHILHAVP